MGQNTSECCSNCKKHTNQCASLIDVNNRKMVRYKTHLTPPPNSTRLSQMINDQFLSNIQNDILASCPVGTTICNGGCIPIPHIACFSMMHRIGTIGTFLEKYIWMFLLSRVVCMFQSRQHLTRNPRTRPRDYMAVLVLSHFPPDGVILMDG